MSTAEKQNVKMGMVYAILQAVALGIKLIVPMRSASESYVVIVNDDGTVNLYGRTDRAELYDGQRLSTLSFLHVARIYDHIPT